jgi:hypothetical protein
MHRQENPRDSIDTLGDSTSYKTLFTLVSASWIVALVAGDPLVLVFGWFVVAIPVTVLLALLRHVWKRRRHGRRASVYDAPSTRRT